MSRVVKLPPFCKVDKGNLVVSLEVFRSHQVEFRDIWLSDTSEPIEDIFKCTYDIFKCSDVSDICLRIRKFSNYE